MMMICSKAGNCDKKDRRRESQSRYHQRCVPHEKTVDCGYENILLDGEEYFCPPCVPYKGLQVGDRVRTLASNSDSYTILHISGSGEIVLKEHPIISFNEDELRRTGEGDMKTEAKYKATGKKLPLKVLARWATDTEFHDFFNNYLKAKCAWQLAALLEVPDYELELNRELVEHAQNHECFIRRLLEKGYIEEVKISTYDKWADDCPHVHIDSSNPTRIKDFVEWAKRMPKKED